MKYIRTEDGIRKVFKKLKDGFYLVKVSKYNYRHYYPDCKVADTIEELCDGFVLESKSYTCGFFVIYNTEDNKEKMKNFKLRKGETLFAFIKTDKGLIYVAKMNEKGELELL